MLKKSVRWISRTAGRTDKRLIPLTTFISRVHQSAALVLKAPRIRAQHVSARLAGKVWVSHGKGGSPTIRESVDRDGGRWPNGNISGTLIRSWLQGINLMRQIYI